MSWLVQRTLQLSLLWVFVGFGLSAGHPPSRSSQLSVYQGQPLSLGNERRQCQKALKFFGLQSSFNPSRADNAQLFNAWDTAERIHGPRSWQAQELFELYNVVSEPHGSLETSQTFLLKLRSGHGESETRDALNELSDLLRTKTSWELKATLASAGILALNAPPTAELHQILGDPVFSLTATVGLIGSIYAVSKGLESKTISPNNRFLAETTRILTNSSSRHMSHLQWKTTVPVIDLIESLKSKLSSSEFYRLNEWIWSQSSTRVEVIFDHNITRGSEGSPRLVNVVRLRPITEEIP